MNREGLTSATVASLRVDLANPAFEPLFDMVLYAFQMNEELVSQLTGNPELLRDPEFGELLGTYAQMSGDLQRLVLRLGLMRTENRAVYAAWDAAQQETAA